ncbi:hypothetical protein [Kandleria vitulina]|uniref:hypothetical protein n=1 Tax=Kandleria vitulina TaxID=1630 RepID=UPI00049049CE|nr:hypothetical protein [Kandleria vitulina]
MRTILLSLKPDVFQNVVTGVKIFEHRKVFPDGPIKAYIYVSRPVQELRGIMILENKTSLSDWKTMYSYDKDAVRRIDEYRKNYRVAMQITKFQDTSAIGLTDIKEIFPKFLIPQMYYYLDGLPLLDYLEKNLMEVGAPITHSFKEITSDMICVH